MMIEGKGDSLPVSAIPDDGTWPSATTQYEKRNIAVHIPVWEPDVCIQCGTCSFVCPHATIRIKAYDPALLKDAPPTFKSAEAKGKEMKGLKFTVQVAPEDCTGCGSCVQVCPAQKKDPEGNKIAGVKAINMSLQEPLRQPEAKNYDFFLGLPETDPALFNVNTVKGSQFVRPLFEYNGACGGCGETPYTKLLTQLFGDRLYIGNATGCSSIYAGNLPTTPYAKRADGRGPTWSNSLFEDAAEFAFGMRQAVAKFNAQALELMARLAPDARYAGAQVLIDAIVNADQSNQAGIEAQRGRVVELKKLLAGDDKGEAESLSFLADYLVKKTVWAIGGDGWGYDIGYGGVDQVMASGERHQPHDPGHRGLLQHGRSDVEIDTSRRDGAIRRSRKENSQEEHRRHDGALRQRLRGTDRFRGEPRTNSQGHAGGGVLRRPLSDHRLFHLYQPGHRRYGEGRGGSENGSGSGPLAPVPVQPETRGRGEEPAGPRQSGPEHPLCTIRIQREPLQIAEES